MPSPAHVFQTALFTLLTPLLLPILLLLLLTTSCCKQGVRGERADCRETERRGRKVGGSDGGGVPWKMELTDLGANTEERPEKDGTSKAVTS